MKKTLLKPLSSLFTPQKPKLIGFLTTLLFVFCIGFTNKTAAQCNYLYQGFEGFRTSVVAAGTAVNPGLLNGYTNVIRAFGVGANANSYGGVGALQFTSASGYLISPKISSSTNEGTITFSFWGRMSSTAISSTLIVQTSTDYPGSGNPALYTWSSALITASLTTNVYGYYSCNFNPGTTGVYVRILRSGGSNTPVIDDVAWSSNIAAENALIVMPNVTSPCYSTAAKAITFSVDPLNSAAQPAGTVNSATNLASGVSYKLIDNGGDSDAANTDSYNLNQDNTVAFTPASGDRIEFNSTTVTSGSVASSLTLSGLTTGSIAGPISAISAAAYVGNYCENATLRYQTATTGTAGAGLYTLVRSTPPSSCVSVTGLTVTTANITYSAIPLTWTQITGCSIPAGGFDYYASAISTAPTSGTTPTGNTPSGSATGVTVTGLTGGTPYYIWVRTNCGGSSYGSWIQITGSTATTLCTPQNVTYTEDFQGLSVIRTCTSTAGSSSYSITSNAGNEYFSTNSVGISFYTQPINLDSTKIYRLSYDYANSTNASSTFQIYYGSTNYVATTSNINTSVSTFTANSSTFTTGRYYFQPSSTGIYYIRFALNSNTGGVLNLDNIEVKEVPCFPAALPTVLSGPANPCSSTSVVYSVTANATATSSPPDSYSFTAPTGWVITGVSGNSVTVLTGAIPGNITVTSNLTGCDSSLPVNFPVSASAPPALPSAITGQATVCTALPTANLTYSVTNVPGTTYNWVFPSGWTQTAGGTSNSVTYTASASAVSGTITVTPTNGGCNGTPRTLNVVVGVVSNAVCANAVTITSTASDTFRCSTRHFWYKFTPPCNGDYKVNLSGNGGDIDLYVYSSALYTCGGTNPANLNTNLLAIGFTSSATESVNLTGLSTALTYYILVHEFSVGNGGTFNLSALSTTLSTIGTISGSSSVSCSSVTTTTYTVPAVSGAISYIWTLPAGWSGSSSTNSITVTTSGTTGGTISVVASGACGTTVPATKLIAVGQIQPDAIVGSTNLCSPFTATTYTVNPVIGATSYIWTLPPGWSGTSSTNTITITPNATSGNITVAATGPCGISAATSLAVTTTASVITTNAAICQLDSGFLTSVLTGVNSFSMSNIPAGTSNTFVRPNSNATTFTSSGTTVVYTTVAIVPSVTGAYTFNGCDSSNRDTFMTIYDTSFNPASPGTNFLSANDDSNGSATCNVDPRITLNLVAGQTYIIVYSGFYAVATIPSISGITITVTPPTGGSVQLGTTDWYLAASGGLPIYSGNVFNPDGVLNSGVTGTATPFVHTYFATNSQSSFCRTLTTFTISAAPTQSITPVSGNICPNSVYTVNSNRTGTGVTTVWTSSLANVLFSNALGTIPYVPGTNLAIIYVRSTADVTVTATSSVGTCSVTNSVTYTATGFNTWDGVSWSGTSPPTLNDALIMNGNYTTASGETLLGCSCTVNSGKNVVVVANSNISLTNELINNGGTVLFNSGSALLQTNDVINLGSMTYNRNSTPCFKYDYSYWSSPVDSQTLIGLSPGTLDSGFFDYNSAISFWQMSNYNLPMTIGKGYLIRVPNSYPVSPALPLNFTASFVGVPNNGTIPIPVVYNPANELNLIGNPYPSAISATSLVTDPGFTVNGNFLGGTIYLWSHNTAYNLVTNQYLASDYAVWSILGGVNTYYSGNIGVGNSNPPNGNIAAGQGFFIKTVATGTAYFRNSMRLGSASNTSFYRSNSTSNSGANTTDSDSTDAWEKHRIWLDINDGDTAYKQILVGYIQDGTDGLDRLFDGEMVDNGNSITLYTTVDNTKLSIQGRGLTFTQDDIFSLGYKSLTADDYTINLSNFDGLFATQNIYLEDTSLNVIHNLKNGSYSFATESGTFEERFKVRFTTTSLGIPVFSENTVVVCKKEDGLHIDTGAVAMRSVSIYDVTGRLISTQKEISNTETIFTTLPDANQVLLVQITAETGEKVTKKVVY
jgi:hypothetical protein